MGSVRRCCSADDSREERGGERDALERDPGDGLAGPVGHRLELPLGASRESPQGRVVRGSGPGGKERIDDALVYVAAFAPGRGRDARSDRGGLH
jgi:hypothetical protein